MLKNRRVMKLVKLFQKLVYGFKMEEKYLKHAKYLINLFNLEFLIA